MSSVKPLLLQRLEALHPDLTTLIEFEAFLADDVIHLTEECPLAPAESRNTAYRALPLSRLEEPLSCKLCEKERRTSLAEWLIDTSAYIPMIVLPLLEDPSLVTTDRVVSAVSHLRAHSGVSAQLVSLLLELLESVFPARLPPEGSAVLVDRFRRDSIDHRLLSGVHHHSGLSILLLEPIAAAELCYLSTSTRPPAAPQLLAHGVREDELRHLAPLFFSMLPSELTKNISRDVGTLRDLFAATRALAS